MIHIAAQRLHNQQLAQTSLQTPSEVVAWLGAVQAQEYSYAKWALGLRLPGVGDAAIEQAFTDGAILRTHVMRPTWHFVTPADIRWMLELTAPSVHGVSAYMYRKLELDDALFLQSNTAIAKALEGGVQHTRAELALELKRVGILAEGIRLGCIMQRAELDAIVCSGGRRGKQFTYALLDERAPQAKRLPRDEALAELTQRYFTSHGPATIHDFAWWSGLSIADVKLGLALATDVIQTLIGGTSYWQAALPTIIQPTLPTALLLPPYDEYTVGYRNHSAILAAEYAQQAQYPIFSGVTVIDGQIVGAWRRTSNTKTVVIESTPFRPFSAAEQNAFARAAAQLGLFLGLPVVLS
ncbi:MAG: AlkZ family DNA glycosylase [Roseiflexaceae bacterium]|nr:AlkZ family DNA glycosylase [Roseiflexaceae bacterium]